MLRDFWAGLTAPTGFAFGLMLGVALVPLLWLCTAFTPARIAGPIGAYLPSGIADRDGFVTREAIQLERGAPDKASPHRLYLFGDSIVAHSFASDGLLARALDDASGEKWQVSLLSTADQLPLDEAALADYATRHQPGIVVLPFSVERYTTKQDAMVASYRLGRLGFRSDWADRDMRMLGETPALRTGIYVVDNRKFVSRHLWMSARALTGRPVQADNYQVPLQISPPMLARQRSLVLAGLRHATSEDVPNFRVLADTVRRLEARGNRIIFAQDPINPAVFETPTDRALYKAYLRRSFALARRLGGYYCGLQRGGDFRASPFIDYFHVQNRAEQARFRRVLADCVVGASTGAGAL